jgi:lipoate synthase
VKTTYWEIERKIGKGEWEHYMMGGETAEEVKSTLEEMRAYEVNLIRLGIKYRAVRVVEQTTVEKW